MATESNCWKLLELGVELMSVVVTASAAFAGAFFTHKFSEHKDQREKKEKLKALYEAISAEAELLRIEINYHQEQIKNYLKQSDGSLISFPHKVFHIPFNSQHENLSEIRRGLLISSSESSVYKLLVSAEAAVKALHAKSEMMFKFLWELQGEIRHENQHESYCDNLKNAMHLNCGALDKINSLAARAIAELSLLNG